MQLSRDRFLRSAFTTYQGSPWCRLPRTWRPWPSNNRPGWLRQSISILLSFHRLIGLRMRCWKRISCSSSSTENQYLIRMIPARVSISSNSGQARRNSLYSSSLPEAHDMLDARPGCCR